jgi:hypothetical protein
MRHIKPELIYNREASVVLDICYSTHFGGGDGPVPSSCDFSDVQFYNLKYLNFEH